jgi:hypothetical protein
VADSFESFGRKVGKFQKELTDDALMHEIGKMAKAEAKKAATADLGGNDSFSGWSRKKPIELATRYDIVRPGVLSFKPSRRSAGPWTVAEYGRGTSIGPSISSSSLTPTGRTARRRKKRANGRTAGKGTASDALAAIEPKVPKIVDQQIGRAIRKTF